MAAITWKELVGPTDVGAFRALDAAAGTVNAGFGAFDKALAAMQTGNQTQADIARTGNVQAYLDAVQNAKTPEAIQALHDNGTLDALRTKVDPRDLGLIRGADEIRLGAVRKNITEGQTWQDNQTKHQYQGVVQDALTRAMQTKDPAALGGIIAGLPADLPDRGAVAKQIMEAVTGNAKSASDLATADVTRTTTKQNADTNTRNAATNERQATTQEQQVAQQGLQHLETQRAAIAGKIADLKKGTFGSEDGQKSYDAAIKLAAGDKAPTILRLAGEAISSDPKYRNMPTDVVTEIVKKHSADIGTGRFMPDLNVASRIKADLELAYKSPEVQAQMLRTETSHASLSSQLQELQGLSGEAMRKAYPDFSNRLDAAAARAAAAAAPATPDASAAAELQREGGRGAPPNASATAAAAPAPAGGTGVNAAAVANFKLDPAMEQKAKEQEVKMNLGSQFQYTPDVEAYLKAKAAAVDALNTPPAPPPNPAARFTQGAPFTLADAIARRAAAEEAAKKAR